jgi:phage-related protein
MTRTTRPISWIKAAFKEFYVFPEAVRTKALTALTIAAEGGKSDIAKPMQRLGSGVFEIALLFRGDAFRVVYMCNSAKTFGSCMHFRKNLREALRHLPPKSI